MDAEQPALGRKVDGNADHPGDLHRLRLTVVLPQHRAECIGHIAPYLAVPCRVVLNANAPAIRPFPSCFVLFHFAGFGTKSGSSCSWIVPNDLCRADPLLRMRDWVGKLAEHSKSGRSHDI
jgi:hypothetical protein